ncbi:MAG TPA: N-acetylmuramoyl-L-alanine amidase [Myxococcales bacterium]|nr:N-acetylmuramoyl-L-alanine amidase [Myxococcales bacterium]
MTHTRTAALICAVLLAHGGAEAATSGRALQEKRLEAGKAALERLRADAKRRRHRDAWEAVIRELDGSVRAAPGGSRAAEAALWAARAREDLWNVSRSRRDAAAAVAAYRKVDEAYTGSSPAPRALLLAAQLANRTGDAREARSAARRLIARYGGTPEARVATPMARAMRGRAAQARARVGPRQRGVLPVEREEDEEEESPGAIEPAAAGKPRLDPGPPAAVAKGQDGADRPPPPAPAAAVGAAGDDREADAGDGDEEGDEVPAAASRLLDQVIEAARAQAAAAVDTGAGSEGAAGLPPEPEAPEPIVGLTVKAAVPPREEAPAQAGNPAAKARELRSAARKSPASVAAQLGLKMRRVVVDPGHGGRDTGAIGPHGVREKDVALAIARALAQRLRALGFTVILTRKDDSYVSLDERTRIANQARADLFVSVHCNAARRRTLSGVETWTLNVASDRYATRLATFENADAERTVSDLRLILADLATRANATDARDLAQAVQSSLVRNLRARLGRVEDHGVKQALFYVLLGAHMPAILVETGFISNPAEEGRLRSRKYQGSTADAIARGVKEFVDGRQRLARALDP